jgi:hypothetical protein
VCSTDEAPGPALCVCVFCLSPPPSPLFAGALSLDGNETGSHPAEGLAALDADGGVDKGPAPVTYHDVPLVSLDSYQWGLVPEYGCPRLIKWVWGGSVCRAHGCGQYRTVWGACMAQSSTRGWGPCVAYLACVHTPPPWMYRIASHARHGCVWYPCACGCCTWSRDPPRFDVEGMEVSAVKGAAGTIARCRWVTVATICGLCDSLFLSPRRCALQAVLLGGERSVVWRLWLWRWLLFAHSCV